MKEGHSANPIVNVPEKVRNNVTAVTIKQSVGYSTLSLAKGSEAKCDSLQRGPESSFGKGKPFVVNMPFPIKSSTSSTATVHDQASANEFDKKK
jgi:hypothetical protein